jgi:hypothetical protein
VSVRFRFIVTLISGLLLPGGWRNVASAAEEYKVQLVRPEKVGREYRTDTTVFVKRVVRGQTAAFTGELKGTMKALAVNEKNGVPTKLQCTLEKFTRDGKDLYPQGIVIVGQKANHAETFTVNGQPVSPEGTEILRLIMGLTDPAITVSDDQALGTNQPQAVGVTWPVNKALVARQLDEGGMPAAADSVKGESKIVRVKPEAAVNAMLVRTTLTCDLLPHRNPFPGKAAIIGGSASVHQEILLPVDASQPMISATVDMQIRQSFLGRGGPFTISEDVQMTRQDQPKK